MLRYCTLFIENMLNLTLTRVCFEVGKMVALNILLLLKCLYFKLLLTCVKTHTHTHIFQAIINLPINTKDIRKDVQMDVMRSLAIMSHHIET